MFNFCLHDVKLFEFVLVVSVWLFPSLGLRGEVLHLYNELLSFPHPPLLLVM
jgi:hypothetical protein